MATQVTNLENPQQIEVVVNGPEGANRLILCTGIAPIDQEATAGSVTQMWTWRVGPALSRPQFYRAIVDGALTRVSQSGSNASWSLNGLDADWDDESGFVEVRAEVQVSVTGTGKSVRAQGISYQVSILCALAPEPAFPATELTEDTEVIPAATAVLVATPALYDFGAVHVGEMRKFTASISNTGDAGSGMLQIALSGPNEMEFSVPGVGAAGGVQGPVPAHAQSSIEVSFQPISEGQKNASIQISSVPGGTVSVSLAGTGINVAPPPGLIAKPTMLDFGTTNVNTQASEQTVTITNDGVVMTGPLQVTLVGADAGQFTLLDIPTQQLMVGQVVQVRVSFRPAAAGPKSAFLQISAIPGGTVEVALTGTGINVAPPPGLIAKPTMLDFGTIAVNTHAPEQMIAITSMSAMTGPLQVALVGADAGQFTLFDIPTQQLMVGQVAQVRVSFQPTSPGGKNALLQISAMPGGVVTVVLAGMGMDVAPAPGLIVKPTMLDFGTIAVNTHAPEQMIAITSMSAMTGPLQVMLVGANAGQFSLLNNPTNQLIAGQVIQVRVSFQPTSPGGKNAVLQVSAMPGGTLTLPLLGTGM